MLNKASSRGKPSVAMLQKSVETPPDLYNILALVVSEDSENLNEYITLLL